MGEPPDWYKQLRAAQYLGIHPSELAPGVPALVWQERALIAIDAENRPKGPTKPGQEQ